jgi:peptide/nickel transport system substrate-binding protein
LGDFGNGGGDWGAMNWDSPDIAETLEQIAATGDAKTRAPLIEQVATTLHNELPLIPVTWYQHTVAYSKNLENVKIDPLERSYGLQDLQWKK